MNDSMSNDEALEALAERMRTAASVAVITGAGISAESGVPTFRGDGGLWKNYRAEELATPGAFQRDPELVWSWYDWRRGICAKAEPNPAHLVTARLEDRYKDFLLITQNVDGLHGRAGSRRMAEIHGNIWRGRCTACGDVFDTPETPLPEIPVPCPSCGGRARPHIVWFGESYDSDLMEGVYRFLMNVEVLLVIGTSGMVSMPVVLADQARRAGAFVAEVNPNPSELSSLAHAVLRGKAGELLPELERRLGN